MTEIFLGAIAVATLVMAIIQVGAVVFASRLARKVERLSVQLEKDIRPLLGKLTDISTEASRTAALAAIQMERVDRLVADLSERVEQTVAVVQNAIITPAREGLAVVSAVKAALAVFRGWRVSGGAAGGAVEEEDALFIG